MTPAFTSSRERRLWISVLVVVAAIWSTLGLAQTVTGALRNRGLLDAAFAAGALAIAGAIVVLGLRARPRAAEAAAALGVAAVFGLAFVRMAIPEERTHLVEYGVVAILILEALRERRAHGRRVPAPALAAFGASALLGVVDELIQLAIPSRVFDPVDILVNVAAAAMAVVAGAVLGRARRLELREITDTNRDEVLALRVAPHQDRFVGSVAGALADAEEYPEGNAWPRAIYEGDRPVGFVMLSWDVEPDPPRIIGPWFLWKLIVDRRHQRRGVGRTAVSLVADVVRAAGGTELLTSHVEGDGDPGPFYARLGFLPTGDRDENGEVILALDLA